ncbi:hypothetical protein Barb4_02665 [Bacteroidales bacterium Barb4]|nr:hypothetical protein Barb4_02665 [Bacteroidales bacterium Barb4]
MGNVSKDRGEDNQTKKSDEAPIEFTAKGNRLYRFTPVTEEERKRLRVDVYPYLL